MADRTVRAIFEARVSGAQKGMRDLSGDVDKAGKKVDGLTKDLARLDGVKAKPKIDVAIDKAQREIKEITLRLGDLRQMEVTPEVTADIRQAEKQLRDARAALRELNAAKATMKVDADTAPARKAMGDLSDDVADAGAEGGAEAGANIAGGILDALRTIPIAGAVIGVGAAIAGGILIGIKQGLAIEAERDLFSAQTGLDEDTSARFGRAAGEAYANAWGDSVADNLDTARRAMQAGIIDASATDAEIQNIIEKFTGIQTLFDYDIQMAVQGVGNALKTGLVRDADEAFDLIVAASQKLPSDDLLETLNEYSNQFATMGLEGEAAFGLIVQGAEAGARDTDKVADSLKELGLRIREGLDPARDALSALDLDVDDTIAAFQEGGPRAAEAIDRVFDALRVLKTEGGNTQEVIAALFGGPGEDLGAALFALDLSTVAEALGGIDGAAGAADRALATMADNTATRMEEAKRNVEIAMDGIKGALAEAFGDEISGAAEWVKANRAPLMEFFLDVINGAFRMGIAFVEFGATAIEALADLADAAADILVFLPGFSLGDKRALQEEADGLRGVAESMRTDFVGEIEAMQEKANAWAAPEIMAARLHDAKTVMAQDMRDLEEEVGTTEFSVTINGDTLNAEEALAVLTENIDASDGTVRINGDKVPAEDAVARLMELVEDSEGDVTVGGDTDPARDRVGNLMRYIGGQSSSVKVNADTSSAENKLRLLIRDRYVNVRVVTSGTSTLGGITKGAHSGGWLPGRYTGGWVPGRDPGYDNVLWPLHSGGMTLSQPLAGGEFVVASKPAGENAALLEFLNAGGKLGQQPTAQSYSYPVNIEKVIASDLASIRREAERERAYRATRDGLG